MDNLYKKVYAVAVSDPEKSRDRWLFSKMGAKYFKKFFCRSYPDMNPSDLTHWDEEYLTSFWIMKIKEKSPIF